MRAALGTFLLVALAGCASTGHGFAATASDALLLPRGSMAYDGQGARWTDGWANLSLDAARDEGRVDAVVVDVTRRHDVRFESFAGTADHQQGGVARDVRLHGATGNGSTDLPEVHAYAAAWGTASYRVDGQRQTDPTSPGDDFRAAAYVLLGQLRERGTAKILNANGDGVYDPARPTDGQVGAAGATVRIELRTATGALWAHVEFVDVRIEKLG